ncbi:MAG TPA: nucleotide sugar dehydrogenase [Terracidiphilus sp.]|nr:nucleotide sugar dehydrogenase [Terracidiphilus sp.]
MSDTRSRSRTESALTQRFCNLISKKQARIGVIGLGYVGLPLALAFAEKGFETTGFDVDRGKVENLRTGISYIGHLSGEVIARQVTQKRFWPTADFARLREMDAIVVCVPTPLNAHREPDLSFIEETAKAISSVLRAGQLVVLESTTYPGTTEEVMLPILERSELKCQPTAYSISGNEVQDKCSDDSDFFLAFSPEREDPGNRETDRLMIPKVIGGVNGSSARLAQLLYGQVFQGTVLVSGTRVAEMTKILENTYRCVNIALVNELKLFCLRAGINIWEVIEAAKTKPFGFKAFYPGPGLGGHCIPVDPFYLSWKAKEFEFTTRFIELAGEINTAMPDHVVEGVAAALDQRGKPLSRSRILVLGVAYKKDVDDTRESPALRIIELLKKRGVAVEYNDPYVPHLKRMRKYDLGLDSFSLTNEGLKQFDCVLIVTDHSSYDYSWIVRESSLVVDTRNATGAVREGRERIVYL